MSNLIVVAILAVLWTGTIAQGPPLLANSNVKATEFLDRDTPIQGFFGQTFLKDNIPYIDIPDKNIQDVYYYRFSVLQRHLRYTTAGTGYMITEFMQPVDYAGPFGTIDAAAGHHIQEAQWLRDTSYNKDYIQLWTRGPGDSARYTHWIMDAAATAANVTGDVGFLQAQLPGMVRMWHQWDYAFDPDVGLYYVNPLWDAQEYSLPGFVTTDGVDNELERTGPQAYRPSINAYMMANARAIGVIAAKLGHLRLSSEFSTYARDLQKAINTLWDAADQQFFVDVGSYPFRFGIGLDSIHSEPATRQLFDPDGFFTRYGPSTLERRNQYYDPDKAGCCFWQGQSWPFSTAHTLKSLASMIRSGATSVTAEQYHDLLSISATTQHKDGVPYVAESHFPEKDGCSADSSNHSEHYMHSTYNDIVITGLLGLIPRADDILEISPIIPPDWTYFALENVPYHGFLITVLYDEGGGRYNTGPGLTIFADGQPIYNGKGTSATVQLPSNNAQQPDVNYQAPPPLDVNVAANPYGLGHWPRASATYTNRMDDPYKAIDGYLFYDSMPDNRWTNYGSPNDNDTLTIELPRPWNLTGIVLAIYADASRTGGVTCPAAIDITDGNGKTLASISDFPYECSPNDKNIIAFDQEVELDTVNINFTPQGEFQGEWAVGVCEVEMWAPANTGPWYNAVDALAVANTTVAFDQSAGASFGAVLAPYAATSEIDFSGIYSATGETATLRLDYKHNGTSKISLGVSVNQVAAGNVTLQDTVGSGYAGVEVRGVHLLKGSNFVTIYGGGDGVFLTGLGVL
ncbi:hypothetical protein LTR37_007376 [Vermiconidia calcicola]|uniref:Uncharacterized protein n=1 Tax=Vermiconidia calcicola TaxID=1690605 RepID=A0ACC3NDS9_9PEZI|nr:hypothetical protein LTR37_007376 [Vermiconidia calcicola]